jgi:hypothetical protein
MDSFTDKNIYLRNSSQVIQFILVKSFTDKNFRKNIYLKNESWDSTYHGRILPLIKIFYKKYLFWNFESFGSIHLECILFTGKNFHKNIYLRNSSQVI